MVCLNSSALLDRSNMYSFFIMPRSNGAIMLQQFSANYRLPRYDYTSAVFSSIVISVGRNSLLVDKLEVLEALMAEGRGMVLSVWFSRELVVLTSERGSDLYLLQYSKCSNRSAQFFIQNLQQARQSKYFNMLRLGNLAMLRYLNSYLRRFSSLPRTPQVTWISLSSFLNLSILNKVWRVKITRSPTTQNPKSYLGKFLLSMFLGRFTMKMKDLGDLSLALCASANIVQPTTKVENIKFELGVIELISSGFSSTTMQTQVSYRLGSIEQQDLRVKVCRTSQNQLTCAIIPGQEVSLKRLIALIRILFYSATFLAVNSPNLTLSWISQCISSSKALPSAP